MREITIWMPSIANTVERHCKLRLEPDISVSKSVECSKNKTIFPTVNCSQITVGIDESVIPLLQYRKFPHSHFWEVYSPQQFPEQEDYF